MTRMKNVGEVGFTMVSNQVLQDHPEMTFKARGLYAVMISYPNDWTYRLKHIVSLGKENISAVRSALRELEDVGLVWRERTRNDDGTMGGEHYVVNRAPASTLTGVQKIRRADEPESGKVAPLQRNTNTKTNDYKETLEKKSSFSKAQAQELVEIFNAHRGNMPFVRTVSDFRFQRLGALVKKHGWDEARAMLEAATKNRAKDGWYGDNNHGLDELLKQDRVVRYAEAWEANKPKATPSADDRRRLDRQASEQYWERTEQGETLQFEDVRREARGVRPVKHAIETKVNEDGIPYIGNPEQGCQHCGFVDVKIYPEGAAEPRMLYYHPGAQCCEAKIKDQIRWRKNDVTNALESVHRILDQSNDVQRRLDYLTGKEKKDAEVEYHKLVATHTKAMRDVTPVVNDLKREIADLEAML